jgi:hypothetical protein
MVAIYGIIGFKIVVLCICAKIWQCRKHGVE